MADSVYWSSFADGAIRGAPLAGGGPVDTLYDRVHGAMGPRAVAIDAAAGRIYWTNQGDLSIRGAPLAGGTDDRLYGPGQAVGISSGLAIDLAWPPRMYWTNEIDDSIQQAPLAGGGTVQSLYYGAPGVNNPAGVAIDRAAGTIYWANSGDNTIRGAPLSGGPPGIVDTLYSGPAEGVYWPNYLAVLRAPVGTAAPTISGPRTVGQPLSCSRGVWAPDLPGSSLYRAPQSFKYRWLRNGAPVGMLSFATYTPTSAGSYACEVTGTNVAGSATQASATVAVS